MVAYRVLSAQVDVFMNAITNTDQPRNTAPDSWLGVEVRHLAALEAVARAGSFGRAASELGYTQSAISQQIAALERIVGERLVERPGGPRAISMTEAGSLLLRHAEAIVNRLNAARADMLALQAGETGSLRVGTYQSIGARVLPEVMRRFRAGFPKIELGLTEPTNDAELYAEIESGRLDLAFCSAPLPDGPFESVGLMADPYVLMLPAEHPSAAAASTSLSDLADLALIGSSSCSSGLEAEQILRDAGHHVEYVFRSDDNGTLQGLVAAGFGAALVPLLAVTPGDERIAVLAIEPPVPDRVISVVWHRDRHRTPAARAFVEIARLVSAGVERDLVAPATASAAA